MRAARLDKQTSHKYMRAKDLDPAKVRQIKEDERRRKSELVHSLRKEYQTTEEKAMSLRRAEAERKKAMHDALLDERYDVGAVAYLQ
uniref:Uncharacterized protein n=1 Tax=Prymnesium polylepis TaxID=72548 RepID=A0A7S4KIM0_9EUKA